MTRTKLKLFSVFFLSFFVFMNTCSAKNTVVNFNDEVVSGPSKYFDSLMGTWYIDKDGNNVVYTVDGSKSMKSTGIIGKAKALYTEFLGNPEFPLSIYRGVKNFGNGTISVKFKAISGRIDQGAGIAFNIKPNGDYLVIRANPLENNIVVFKLKNGSRSSVQWAENIPQESKKWYTLKVVIKGDKVEAYLNNKRYISLKFKNNNGKIGLWSKSDSHIFFDDFTVQ